MAQKIYSSLSRRPWVLATGVVSGLIILLCCLLWWEYRSLQQQSLRIQQLQNQYYDYLDKVKRIIRKQKSEPSDEEAQAALDQYAQECATLEEEDSLMLINRTPEYLKESTVTYLKAQRLDSLLARMNLAEWQDYTDQVLVSAEQPRKKKQTKKARAPKSKLRIRSQSQKRVMPEKRASITGITFEWPLSKQTFWLSSFFGPRKKPSGVWGFHYGLDMAAPRGTPVLAAADGVVELAGYVSGYGNTVIISHDKVYKTRYAHLDKIYTKKGKQLKQGQKLGAVGSTGFTIKSGGDGSHLHLELYERGKQINPLCMLPHL